MRLLSGKQCRAEPGARLQSRPFGVALLIAGWDEAEGGGAVLYQTDPSGTFAKFSAKAIGSGSEGAQTALQVRGLRHELVSVFLRYAGRAAQPSGVSCLRPCQHRCTAVRHLLRSPSCALPAGLLRRQALTPSLRIRRRATE